MKYIVIFDACVLYPFATRDLLMELAKSGNDLFQAKWTEKIESEWVSNLISNRPDLNTQKVQNVTRLMRETIPDCLVKNYETLIPSFKLPDPDDAHVLAAAVRAKAQAIITSNLKDFPADVLSLYDIEAIHPDVFLMNQFDLSNSKVLDAVKTIRARLKNPAMTPREYLERLSSNNLTAFSSCLKEYEHLI